MSNETQAGNATSAGERKSMWNSPGLAALVGLLTAVVGGGGVGVLLSVVLGGGAPAQAAAGGGPAPDGQGAEVEAAKQALLSTGECEGVSESSSLSEITTACSATIEDMRAALDSVEAVSNAAKRAKDALD